MVKSVLSGTIIGIDAQLVTIEVDANKGLPCEHIIGLPDTIIKESRNRVKSAIKNSAFDYPIKAYTINLSPADLPKAGAGFDLAIAAAILYSTKQIKLPQQSIIIGELALDGRVKAIKGIVAICEMAKEKGIKTLIIPQKNMAEASLIDGLEFMPIEHVHDLKQPLRIQPALCIEKKRLATVMPCLRDVNGQFQAKRALEIASSGQHNLLLIGPPGSGKSMLLKRLPSIMPALSKHEQVTCHKIHSLSHSQGHHFLYDSSPPFRQPHHTISFAGMLGGGSIPKPGEITLAHHGLLFLDELPEFSRYVIESLREPLDSHSITVSRAQLQVCFPAKFQLIAAMNPCPCGYYTDNSKPCSCNAFAIKRYLKKVSGPILDRFDMIIDVPKLQATDFLKQNKLSNDSSASIKARVSKARQAQYQRQHKSNAYLLDKELASHASLDEEMSQFLATSLDKGLLTGRSYHKVIKVARSIADLAQEPHIQVSHILEALQCRKTTLFDRLHLS